MNIKTIVLGSLAVTLTVGISYLNLSTSTKDAVYTPRSLSSAESDKAFKGRSEYLNMLRGNVTTGVANPDDYNKIREQVISLSKKKNKASLNMEWEQRGPDNVGGRTRAILIDQDNPNIIYAGGIAGGLFISEDAAASWTPITSLSDNLAVSCITQTDNGRIFFGTGSTFESGSTNSIVGGTGLSSPGFPGNGLYEYSTVEKRALPVLLNSTTIPVTVNNGSLSIVNQIAHIGNKLFIGLPQGLFCADLDDSGNYPSSLTGWNNPVQNQLGLVAREVQDIDVGTDGSVVVCYQNNVYISPDGSDNSFVQNVFLGTGRVSAAIAPSNPDVIYILSSDVQNNALNDVSISTDKGLTWDVVVPGGSFENDPFVQLGSVDGSTGQGVYDQGIAVDPSNPNRVLVGGIQVFEFELNPDLDVPAGSWNQAASLTQSSPFYIHPDVHTIAWNDPDVIYVGSDGGIAKSINGGENWTTHNLGFNVTTFYSVAAAANGFFMGGAQDNGSQFHDLGAVGPTANSTREVSSGDGFTCAFSDFGGGIGYTTAQNGLLFRFLSEGSPTDQIFSDEVSEAITAANTRGGGDPFISTFNTEIRNWESFHDTLTIDSITTVFIEPDTIGPGQPFIYQSLTANTVDLSYEPNTTEFYEIGDELVLPDYLQNRFVISTQFDIYMTKDAAKFDVDQEWHRIADNSGIVSMEFSPDGNHLYLGNRNGQVFRVSGLSKGNTDETLDIDIADPDSLVTTKTMIASGLRGVITGIAVDPNNGENVVVSVGNYGLFSHVYRSTNAQSATSSTGTFESIQGPISSTAEGYLPRMPVFDAEIDVRDHNIVLLGTDFGVWASDNAFTPNANDVEWSDENVNGMAHTPVFEVVQQTLPLGTFPGKAIHSQRYYLGTHGRGFFTSDSRVDPNITSVDELSSNNKDLVANLKLYPNPINTYGTIEFDLYEQAATEIKIYNLTGSLVKTIDLGVQSRGNHSQRIDVSSLSIGSYIIALESNSDRKISKFIVTR